MGRVHLIGVIDSSQGEKVNEYHFERRLRTWRRYAPNLEYSKAAGNHLTVLKQPHVTRLAQLMKTTMATDTLFPLRDKTENIA